MVEQGALRAVLFHVGEPDVVAPEDVVEVFQRAVFLPLLPVEPPEIDALIHVLVQIGVEECLHIFLVASHPLVGLAVVLSVALHELVVLLLVGTHAVGRVQVHRGLHALLVEVGEELPVVGEDALVPVPAGPAAASFLGVGVPVHVDDDHVERQVEAMEVADEVAQVLVAVCPIAAPPVAESVSGRQRHLAGKLREALQGTFVVVPVGHEIPVLRTFRTLSLSHPVPVCRAVEDVVLGIVDERPAVRSQQAVLEGHLVLGVAVLVHVAVVAVKGAIGSLQVAFLLCAGRPGELRAEPLGGGDGEVLRAERSPVFLVGEFELACGNSDLAATRRGLVRHIAILADDSHKTLVVHELTVGSVFEAYCAFVDEGEANMIVAIDFFCLCNIRQEEEGNTEHCCSQQSDRQSFHKAK